MAARNDNQILTDGAGLAAHADDLARSRQEANPDADPELIRRQALTDAALFDSHARNWAYHERRSVGEYYEQNRPEYRSWQPDFDENLDGPDGGHMAWREGETGSEQQGDTLYHAMYRNKAETVDDFLEKYDQLIQNKADTYFDFQRRKINRQDGLADNYEVWLGLSQVTHIKERHPDFQS